MSVRPLASLAACCAALALALPARAQPRPAPRRPTSAAITAALRTAEGQVIACANQPGAGVPALAARVPVEVVVPPGGPPRVLVATTVGAPNFHQCVRLATSAAVRPLPVAFTGAPARGRHTFAIPPVALRRPPSAEDLQGLLRGRARAVQACLRGAAPAGGGPIPVQVRFGGDGRVQRVSVRLPEGPARAATEACITRALNVLRARAYGATPLDARYDFPLPP